MTIQIMAPDLYSSQLNLRCKPYNLQYIKPQKNQKGCTQNKFFIIKKIANKSSVHIKTRELAPYFFSYNLDIKKYHGRIFVSNL